MRSRFYHILLNWESEGRSPSSYLNLIREEYRDVFEVKGAFHPTSDSSRGHVHVLVRAERSLDPCFISMVFAVPLMSVQPVWGLTAVRRWEKYIIGAKGAKRI